MLEEAQQDSKLYRVLPGVMGVAISKGKMVTQASA
jgi:hypothetical protein